MGQDEGEGTYEPLPQAVKQFYSKDDFYFLDKTGKRTTLELYQGKIVVQFMTFGADSVANILRKQGLKPGSWERITANFGASALKRTLYSSQGIFIVSLPPFYDGLKLVNSLLLMSEVADASPVFRVNGELVYPAGILVNEKFSSIPEKNNLHGKLTEQGYYPYWADVSYKGEIRPPGVSVRLNYYSRMQKISTNPLRLSRLVAQDVLALWAVPDFIPLKQPIEVSVSLSRPSGTMNDRFEAVYRIKYNPKKVVLDKGVLKSFEPMSLKPKAMAESFFKPDPPRFEESAGNITVKISFKMYEPGSFELSPLVVRYNFSGAEKDTLPEVLNSPAMGVKIAGLVPRDSEGRPQAADIFGWKKMGRVPPEIPPMPKAEDYPPTDARFYAKGIQTKYPALGSMLMFSSYFIFAVLASFGMFFLGRMGLRRMLLRQGSRAAEFARIGTARSAKRYVREILRAPDGKTGHELLEECPDAQKECLEELILLLDNSSGTERLSDDDIAKVRKLAGKLKRGMKWK